MNPRCKILIIDDNPIDRETCRRFLNGGPTREAELVEQSSIEGALKVVTGENPDCILLDYHLHDGNGIDFLHELQRIGGPRAYPVIMLTGTGSESIAVEVMKAGAQDYITKAALTPEILQRAVGGAIYKAQTERLIDSQRVELERLFREAREANDRKDHFLAALSHELRTPLTPILAAVSSVDVENSPPHLLRDIFAMIRRNIELEARLIDDMLDLTRIASGKLELDRRPGDLHNVLRHAVETCRDEIDAKNLTLDWVLEAREHHALIDAARMQQVFWNLLKNAVKFTPPEGRITLSSRNLPDGKLEIEVADSGIGIPADGLRKIFDAFEQGSAKITRKYGGLGLGLAICKALMEAHGGGIRVESDGPGKGTRFFITLERVAGESAASPAAAPAGSPAANDGSRSIAVLLVEDHEDSAMLLSHLMEMNGYEVHVAHTVADAVETFRNHKIDGIVSDIGLPDGTGIDVLRNIHAIRNVPAIALSGFGMEHDEFNSREAGFEHHLTKPVDWPKLEATLARMFDGEKSGKR